jgi:hypothetical protein
MRHAAIAVTFAAALLLTLGSGCVLDQPQTCSGPDCSWELEEELERPSVEGVFVSGHLGNYNGCPDQGYTPEDSSGEPSGDFAPTGGSGACAPGQECRSFAQCEDAQITVRLSNDGPVAAEALQVTEIELFDTEGTSRATLPLVEVVDTDTGEVFDGRLEPGEEVTLRIEYLGPQNPYQMLETSSDPSGDGIGQGYGGTLEITFEARNHDDVVVESAEIYSVPSIAT